MAQYTHQDHYFLKAKSEGKINRASYKLEELQKKFKIIRRGDRVVDLGCAPGGWLVQLADIVGPAGRVVGIDLEPPGIPVPKNSEWVQTDIDQLFVQNSPKMTPALRQLLGGPANAVVSDMAPHTSGTKFQDQARSAYLLETAWAVAEQILIPGAPGGHFVAKFFESPDAQAVRKQLLGKFDKVTIFSPAATRKGSTEKYLVAMGFKK